MSFPNFQCISIAKTFEVYLRYTYKSTLWYILLYISQGSVSGRLQFQFSLRCCAYFQIDFSVARLLLWLVSNLNWKFLTDTNIPDKFRMYISTHILCGGGGNRYIHTFPKSVYAYMNVTNQTEIGFRLSPISQLEPLSISPQYMHANSIWYFQAFTNLDTDLGQRCLTSGITLDPVFQRVMACEYTNNWIRYNRSLFFKNKFDK